MYQDSVQVLSAPPAGADPKLVDALLADRSHDPHGVLGVHPLTQNGQSGLAFRALHPDAVHAELLLPHGKTVTMEHVRGGLFVAFVPGLSFPAPAYQYRFKLGNHGVVTRQDPYRFLPTLQDLDLHLFGEGRHLRLHEKMGAHPRVMDGVEGVSFSVWAPNAQRVSVVGTFNNWDGRHFPMRMLGSSGVWELFLPGLKVGELYKFEMKTKDGHLRVKSDPFSFAMEMRPNTASVVHGLPHYGWSDGEWMESRKHKDLRRSPMAVYEVHAGSWKRVPEQNHRFLNYRELADQLVPHLKEHGFNYVEFLPLAEHPFDGSWGYQVTGYFAPTSRFGTPEDFCYLVDKMHQNGIGVIIDWVPSHFPRDDFALRRFDGTALYEHEDPRLGEHKDWGTLIFNYGRHEVKNFLLSNALFWLDRFHVDGLRVDAVASMIYRDYSRQPGEWIPNKYGGKEDLEAIAFLQEFNTEVYAQHPGAFTVAEESTAFTGVSRPVHLGGLGFGFKWNMGWMNDTLRYFHKEPIHRKYHHNDMTFSMLYAYTENFILPLSHDEVSNGKGSLYDKMPGDHWQHLANLRLLYTYMFTHPGKKLLFQGAEFGQGAEWGCERSVDWHETQEPERAGTQRFFKELAHLYQREKALWSRELEPGGFSWIDCNDSDTGVVSYLRFGEGETILVALNLTPVVRHNYRVGAPNPGFYREIMNSDASIYGGSNVGNAGGVQAQPVPHHNLPWSVELLLPPLSGVIFRVPT